MPQIALDFFLFLWAVLSYWQAYATGGFVTAIVGLFERFSKWQLTKRAYAGLFIGVFLFVAFFLAWRDEHTRSVALTKKLEENKPDIRFNVEDIALVRSAETTLNDTAVVLYLTVRNVGQMPSVVEKYSFTVKPPNRGIVRAEIIPMPEAVVFLDKGKLAEFGRGDAIYNKTLKPISPGAIERGIMTFLVRGVKEPEMVNAICTLSWHDVMGTPGSIEAPLVMPPPGWRPPFVPGIEGKPLPSLSPEKR